VEPNRLRDEWTPNTTLDREDSDWLAAVDSPPRPLPAYPRGLVALGVFFAGSALATITLHPHTGDAERTALGIAFGWFFLGLGLLLASLGGLTARDGRVWRVVGVGAGLGLCVWVVLIAAQGVPLLIIGIVALPFVASAVILRLDKNPD